MAPQTVLILPDQAEAVGYALARAFIEDPGCRYMFPDRDRRLRVMRWIFTRWVRVMARRGAAYSTPALIGAALWLPPDRASTPGLWELVCSGFLRAPLMLSPTEQARGLRLHLDAMARTRRHVDRPHWILDTLGVAPEGQGAGVAKAMVQAGVDRADAAQLPCYVITHKQANIAFYQRTGFEVVESSPVRGLNIIVTSLRRKAR